MTLKNGNFRFARWDGGPLETVKAMLSNWYYISDPQAIDATSNWYNGSNSLELLLAAHINWIWVTFSNGFSAHTEDAFHHQLDEFVGKCAAHGISVTAYMSMVNVFIDDMRRYEPHIDEWLQTDLQGGLVPYGAATYVGAPTRLLACLNHPEWREYLLARLRKSITIGCNGVMYDNFATLCRCERCRIKWEEYQKPLPM